MPTICPFLWNRAYIDAGGNVFFCCHKQSAPLGNIYNDTLSTIWHNKLSNKYREEAIIGKLNCFNNCLLLSNKEKQLQIPPKLILKKVHIEQHEFCNINCIMCYQKDIKNKKRLHNQILLKNIDFSNINEVQLQGGEPLAYKESINLFKILSLQYNVPVTLQTNGLLLNDEYIEIIVKHSYEIMISLNAATQKTHEMVNSGSSFIKVLANINKLQKERNKINSQLKIEGQMTMIKENIHELPDFIQFAEDIKLDSISVSWERSIPQFLLMNPLNNEIKRRLCEIQFWDKEIFLKTKHIERLCKLFCITRPYPKSLGRISNI